MTGSIAIYKALELVRLYIKAGAKVRVIMTEGATKFITPLTFEAVSQHSVLILENESWANDNNHIDIGKWADLFIIAPATANTINKLSNGIADNLLTQTALAYRGVKLIAPAANTAMYQNAMTQASLKMLKLNNYELLSPVKKLLACGDEGEGALAEIEDIYQKSIQVLIRDTYWSNRRVVITGGGTIEKIDDIRYISNFSSGKMANALALALYLKGADVCLITTKKSDTLPSGIYQIDVQSAEEMHEYVVDAMRVAKKGVVTKPTLMNDSAPTLIQKEPYLFMAAAVSDFTPKFPQSGKLKKESIGEAWNLEMRRNIDILQSIDKEGIVTVGFKAEMDKESGAKSAQNMLKAKELDAVCLNFVSDHAFGSDHNAITLFTNEESIDLGVASKFEIALKLVGYFSKSEYV